jgi:hypothetical protein
MEPFSPTATNWPPCHVTPRNVLPCGDGLAQIQSVCACASEQAVHSRNTTNDLRSLIMLPDKGVPDLRFHKIEERSSAMRCAFTQVRRICDKIQLAHEREKPRKSG